MSFTGKKIKDTYRGLININDTNDDLNTSLQTLKDGSGNESPLKLATDKIGMHDYVFPTADGAANQVLGTDGNGQLSWTNTTVIDWANFGNDIIPDGDQTRDLGSPTRQWRDLYVGPGSLYVNGKKVLSDDSGTIVVSTDLNQNLSVKTTGTGNLELAAEGSGSLTFKSDINIQAGFTFYSTNSEIDFGDDINMNNRTIKGLAAPTNPNDAARKTDVDAITLAYTPVNKAGDSMTGELAMGNNKITGLGEPTTGTDATTKNYVDNAVAGLKWKNPVRAATVSNVTLNSNLIVDGVSLVSGDRVLVKNQTDSTQNGIYVVVGAGGWIRATDSDNNPGAEIGGGTAVFVEGGNVNGGIGYVITSPAGTANLGTDPIVWSAFTGATALTAGDGLESNGNTLSVDSSVVRTTTFNGLGDARYAILNALNTFTMNQTIKTAGPRLDFWDIDNPDNTKRWYLSLGTSGFTINRLTDEGTYLETPAIFEPVSSQLTDSRAVVTRAKGDARYVKLTGSTITGIITFTSAVTINNSPSNAYNYLDFGSGTKKGTIYGNSTNGDMSVLLRTVSGNQVWYTFSPLGASTVNHVLRISDGDTRYVNLNEVNNPTGAVNLTNNTGGSEDYVGGAILKLSNFTPGIEFTDKTTPETSLYVYNSNGNIYFQDRNGFVAAKIDNAGTGVANSYTIVTREKGDARYAAISSDISLKENIIDAPEALPILEQLRPVQFTWKNTEEEGDLTHFGLLAQEVAEIIPSAVRDAGNGLGLELRDLISLLVKSVKELSAEVKKLKGE